MATSTATSDRRRIAGIDRQTVIPALLVLAFAVFLSVVLPYIDSRTPYNEQVHAGDVAAIANGITLVPSPGWNLATGVLVGDTRSPVGSTATTQLIDEGVSFYVHAAPFDGTPSALLTRINEINADLEHTRGSAAATTDRYNVTTDQGAVGVAEDFMGVERQGTIVAFVFRRHGSAAQGAEVPDGVEVVVAGPTGPIARRRDDIVAMIRSIRAAS